MRTLLATLSQLVLGLWIGSLVFFGAILAPVAFHVLLGLFPSHADGTHAAGLVVGSALARLHSLGLVCGFLFLLFTLALSRFSHWHSYVPQTVLVLAMMGLTAYSQFSILPRMDTARDSVGGEIESVSPSNPGRQIFDHLHGLSTRVEGIVLVCGLVAFLFGGRTQKPRPLV